MMALAEASRHAHTDQFVEYMVHLPDTLHLHHKKRGTEQPSVDVFMNEVWDWCHYVFTHGLTDVGKSALTQHGPHEQKIQARYEHDDDQCAYFTQRWRLICALYQKYLQTNF
jgi:hypothetical protein